MEGNNLKVSDFLNAPDGTFPSATTRLEKCDISEKLSCYNSEACLTYNMCSLFCPHGVIRPFLLDEKEVIDAP